MALIEITELNVNQRLRNIELDLHSGEVLGLIGPNGAGKSTLLHCLASIEKYQGKIQLNGSDLQQLLPQQRAQQLALLPQKDHSAWALSVRDIITLGRLPWQDEDAEKILHAAELAGVSHWLDQPVDQLSGGEQARVWLARVLAGEPQVLMADEPLASLDLYYQFRVLELLRSYAASKNGQSQPRAVLVSIHDLSLAARYCDRLCLLHQGRIIALGTPAEVLTPEHLHTAYQVNAQINLNANPPFVTAIG
jgi:ABC-type cobalamin/Fe3+-siderophores transport system ATPase subunit